MLLWRITNKEKLIINSSLKQDNPILVKPYHFGLCIVKLYLHLKKRKIEVGLCSQFLRNGTSIVANVEATRGGTSRKDFINKLQGAYKEVRECRYWLRLLKDSGIVKKTIADSFVSDCEELLKFLTSMVNSSKQKDHS